MAKPLQSASIAAPGFFGLNTQESSITLAAGFALQADNCVIDKYGRLGARKGWQLLTQGHTGVNLLGAHEFIDINGTRYFGAWSDTGFYIVDGSTLTSVTYSGDNTISGTNWQAATLNDAAFLFDRNYKPIYFQPTTGTLEDLEDAGHGVPPSANTVLSAYGRLWAADTETNKTTVYWSDLLDGTNWNSGTSGSIDLSSVLVNGNDEIVALGAHAGRLIIFCKDNVVIYGSGSSTLDPSTMELVEVINGVGCISRDSVQNTGVDILFLAKDGLRSLGRLIQEKSQPMRDLSKNIRDELVRSVLNSDPTEVKSVYSASEAFYLLLIPEYQRIYCFDTRSMLQDGSARVTVWDNQVQTNMIEANNTLYFTGIDGMSRYYGYSDNGSSYTIKYYTNYFDFGDSTKQKFLKRLSTTLIGGSGQDIVLKVGYDYDDSYRSFPIEIATQSNAEYGVAEYNTTAEYTVGTLSDTVRAPVGGSGGVLQVGFEATINGSQLSIQKLDIYTKEGRVY
jgi:hypothetical protein